MGEFATKTGKFAKKGMPYKMGLLLHGPPGTGRSSLIKCISESTGRHVVNIPLKVHQC
jgi:chaperone BCS1